MLRWILVGLISFTFAQSKQSLPVVSVAEVKQTAFQPVLKVPGNINAINGANLSLESAGVITNIYVVSGQKVKKGDLLLDLDNSSQKASYDASVTTAKFAQIEFDRQKGLFEQGVVSAETFDSAQTQLVDALSAVVTAKVALDHRSLVAPYDGQVGVIQLSIGQYVGAGTALLSLLDLSKMRVDFAVGQETYSKIKTGLTFVINNPIQAKTGEITAISPVIDGSSGQAPIQGVFDNIDPTLPSGLLVDVAIYLDKIANQILIPASAVSYSLSGDYVYVVDDIQTKDGKKIGKVTQVIVSLGRIGNDDIMIESGLKAGQMVVSAGANKLTGSGASVQIDTETPLPH